MHAFAVAASDRAARCQSGTPEQENGCDCGVFLVCTADYLARDARLDFTKADMEHYRHRMVYQLIQQQMLP